MANQTFCYINSIDQLICAKTTSGFTDKTFVAKKFVDSGAFNGTQACIASKDPEDIDEKNRKRIMCNDVITDLDGWYPIEAYYNVDFMKYYKNAGLCIITKELNSSGRKKTYCTNNISATNQNLDWSLVYINNSKNITTFQKHR